MSDSTARPTWSVMIPVHDCAGYLAHTLGEVVAQLGERGDAEIVVLDDDSTDDPAAVVAALNRDRVQVRFEPNPHHLGAIGTFNRALELARGEYVHLLHGDDAVLPGFYATMQTALDAQPGAVAALCRTRDTDAQNVPGYLSRHYRHGTGIWSDALESLALSNRVRAPGMVVRASAYRALGGFRAELPHAADWEMWTRLAAHGPIVFVDEVLADYRKHAGSDTTSRTRTGLNVRERVTAIGVVSAHVPAIRRRRVVRRALAYAVVFAARTGLGLARRGEWRIALRQWREAGRCARLAVSGTGGHPSRPAAP